MKTTKDYIHEFIKTADVFYELSNEESKLLKKCLLDIYLDVAAVCNKYNLCIMLGGGSALGAVRHQGFIPWDDDLDALMPRKDYNKLIEIFEKELGEKYLLSVPRTDNTSEFLFMAIEKKNTLINQVDLETDICGIRIDVFPIENVPDNILIRTIKGYSADVFMIIIRSLRFYLNKKDLFKKSFMRTYKTRVYYCVRYLIGLIVSIFFTKKFLFDKYDKFVSSSKGKKYCGIPTGRRCYRGEIHPRSAFFPPTEALFEGVSVHVPHDVDAYLKRLYGDYMKIPSIEKRESHSYTKIRFDTT
jgi:lipopolysaccharide cholinephosphotransferase